MGERELLRALADQGKAVLISSHILTELAEICDACAIIEQGRLLATGKVADILAQASGTAVAELVVRLFPSSEGEAVWTRAERLLLEQPRVKQVAREGDALRVRLEHEGGPAPACGWWSCSPPSPRTAPSSSASAGPTSHEPRAGLRRGGGGAAGSGPGPRTAPHAPARPDGRGARGLGRRLAGAA